MQRTVPYLLFTAQCMKFGQLIVRKIIKIVASTPDAFPIGAKYAKNAFAGAYSAPQVP